MKRLSICVPHYKEPEEVFWPWLDSIQIQQQVDLSEIEVVIAYDGPEAEELPRHWFTGESQRYSFDILAVKLDEHQGVSAARNAALEASSGEYVMFCDADDMFCDVCAFYVLFHEMDEGFDTLVTAFREETKDPEGNFVYALHELDSTFVHGKVHRRG